jgi:hypothetical protein
LLLQPLFEPEISPVGNKKVLNTVNKLREALEKSRMQEANCEQKWKARWGIQKNCNTTGWV